MLTLHSAVIIRVLLGEQLISRHVEACTQSFELSSRGLGQAWRSMSTIAAALGENAPCMCLGTSMWLHNSRSSLVMEVALLERESLWSPAVGISLFSNELNQLSSQLVKEGRK